MVFFGSFLRCKKCIIIIIIIIIIIKNESTVQVCERMRTLFQYEDPISTQPTHGRKIGGNSRRQKERED